MRHFHIYKVYMINGIRVLWEREAAKSHLTAESRENGTR